MTPSEESSTAPTLWGNRFLQSFVTVILTAGMLRSTTLLVGVNVAVATTHWVAPSRAQDAQPSAASAASTDATELQSSGDTAGAPESPKAAESPRAAESPQATPDEDGGQSQRDATPNTGDDEEALEDDSAEESADEREADPAAMDSTLAEGDRPEPTRTKHTPQITIGRITCAEAASYSPNPGTKGSKRIVLPSQDVEVGGEMVFITADERLDAFGDQRNEIRYTDVGLLRLRGRRSFNDWLEIYAGTSLLAKQPADWNEAIWQGAQVGARMVFTDGLAAKLGGGGGPLFEERGHFWQLTPELQFKYNADHLLRFDLGLGSNTLVIDARADTETFWLEELVSHAETQFGDHHGAFWVRLDYAVPLASGPGSTAPDAATGRFLDPQVRLSMQAGGVLTIRSGWDAFLAYTFVDRGELDRPETMLPILDEGFDQSQIMLGVQHRFEVDTCKRRVCGRCED